MELRERVAAPAVATIPDILPGLPEPDFHILAELVTTAAIGPPPPAADEDIFHIGQAAADIRQKARLRRAAPFVTSLPRALALGVLDSEGIEDLVAKPPRGQDGNSIPALPVTYAAKRRLAACTIVEHDDAMEPDDGWYVASSGLLATTLQVVQSGLPRRLVLPDTQPDSNHTLRFARAARKPVQAYPPFRQARQAAREQSNAPRLQVARGMLVGAIVQVALEEGKIRDQTTKPQPRRRTNRTKPMPASKKEELMPAANYESYIGIDLTMTDTEQGQAATEAVQAFELVIQENPTAAAAVLEQMAQESESHHTSVQPQPAAEAIVAASLRLLDATNGGRFLDIGRPLAAHLEASPAYRRRRQAARAVRQTRSSSPEDVAAHSRAVALTELGAAAFLLALAHQHQAEATDQSQAG